MPKVKDKVWEEVVVYPKHGAHRVRVRVGLTLTRRGTREQLRFQIGLHRYRI
jgi:hypothetical protein